MVAAGIAVLGPCALFAQQAPAPKTFEVASVKKAAPWDNRPPYPFQLHNDPAQLDIRYINMTGLLTFAYDVQAERVTGPEWVTSEMYDVVAKKPPGTSDADTKLMLQRLLAERFKLEVHREPKEVPGFVLTVKPGGPRMQAVEKPAVQRGVAVGKNASVRRLNTTMNMEAFLRYLERATGRPVTDQTELKGYFEISMEWSPDDVDAAKADVVYPPLSKAIEDQLGLHLEPRKTRIGILVVDRGLKVPLAN
jgi:uncharacterized protein (TIGR03435 family)